MADNYLGRKMEEYEAQKCASVRTRRVSLDSLLTKNSSMYSFDQSFNVRCDQLISLINTAKLATSLTNQQVFDFRIVTAKEVLFVTPNIDFTKRFVGQKTIADKLEPNAYIVICTDKEGEYGDIDLGMVVQTILLRAAEMGLGGICVTDFDNNAICKLLQLVSEPRIVIAIGRPIYHIG